MGSPSSKPSFLGSNAGLECGHRRRDSSVATSASLISWAASRPIGLLVLVDNPRDLGERGQWDLAEGDAASSSYSVCSARAKSS